MSALCLRIIASVCMLLDHIGYILPQYPVLRCIGRLAFPLYVFLLVNGYRHTKSRPVYALRLGLFALLSQLPFSLFCGYDNYFLKGNVFFTLLFALMLLWLTDSLAGRRKLRFLAPLPALLAYGLCHVGLLPMDYGAKGFLLALTFYYLGDKKLLCLLASFVSLFHAQLLAYGIGLLQLLLGREAVFAPPTQWVLLQLFALAALPLIWLYTGKKGWSPASHLGKRALQWSFYLFYPAHLLILYLLT